MDIKLLNSDDLKYGFIETLSYLSEVKLTLEQAEEILKERKDYLTYIVLDESLIIGTATLFLEKKFIHSGGVVGHIEDVVVRPEYEKKGIGKLLVNTLLIEAEKYGCYKVILNCFENLTPFYEKCGFKQHDIGMRKDVRTNGV